MKLKSTQHIDDLGRIRIPKEIRKELQIHEGNSLTVELVNEKIVITKLNN